MSQLYIVLSVEGDSPCDELIKGGVQAHASGVLALAEAHYNKALELEPTNPIALQNLAVCYAQEGKFSDATITIERAVIFCDGIGIIMANEAAIALDCF